MSKGIPRGLHTLTPQLVVRDGARAIEFYKRAFGAEEVMRMTGPDGKSIGHAELRIGDSVLFLNDEFPQSAVRAPESVGAATSGIQIYVEDVDAAFARAVSAGAQVRMAVENMFWGDRFGVVVDPFGHQWGLATHVEEVTPQQLKERAEAFWAKMKTGGAAG